MLLQPSRTRDKDVLEDSGPAIHLRKQCAPHDVRLSLCLGFPGSPVLRGEPLWQGHQGPVLRRYERNQGPGWGVHCGGQGWLFSPMEEVANRWKGQLSFVRHGHRGRQRARTSRTNVGEEGPTSCAGKNAPRSQNICHDPCRCHMRWGQQEAGQQSRPHCPEPHLGIYHTGEL